MVDTCSRDLSVFFSEFGCFFKFLSPLGPHHLNKGMNQFGRNHPRSLCDLEISPIGGIKEGCCSFWWFPGGLLDVDS